MIWVVHPGSRSGFFNHPGSRIQGLKRHRIPDPMNNPDHISESLETIFEVNILKLLNSAHGTAFHAFQVWYGYSTVVEIINDDRCNDDLRYRR
jgi:hypothetical protein